MDECNSTLFRSLFEEESKCGEGGRGEGKRDKKENGAHYEALYVLRVQTQLYLPTLLFTPYALH